MSELKQCKFNKAVKCSTAQEWNDCIDCETFAIHCTKEGLKRILEDIPKCETCREGYVWRSRIDCPYMNEMVEKDFSCTKHSDFDEVRK